MIFVDGRGARDYRRERLVYAMDADHPHHAASRALLDAARNRSTTLYVMSQILCEFNVLYVALSLERSIAPALVFVPR
jgi:predicted nucleic acid-binding protein